MWVGQSTHFGSKDRCREGRCRASATPSWRRSSFDEGRIASSLLANYLVPTSDDMPDVMVDIVESGEGKGPMNARGIGEAVIGNVAPTIANAVADAIGCRPTQLPITPERVLALLDAADHTSAPGSMLPVAGA